MIRPVGSTQAIPINIRLISATHRDLMVEMKSQQFREDLFYRINVVNLVLPSLAERREDIPLSPTTFSSYLASAIKDIARLCTGCT